MRLTFILDEIWTALRRNVSMAVSVMLVMMVSVLFTGFGLLAQRQVDALKGYWYDRVQVSIFLCTDKSNLTNCASGKVTDVQREQVRSQLQAMRPLVEKVYQESQQDAYKELRKQFKDTSIYDNVKPEQIPESFRVQLSDPTKYEVITSAFTGAPGVGQVQDQRKILEPLFRWLNKFTLGAWVLAALMVLCSILLVATTIRQTAFSRRRETGIMRLVGATAFTIHLPFILETLLATVVGAVLGVVGLWAAVRFLIPTILSVGLAIPTASVWQISPWLVAGAALGAAMTSWFTLRRYLRV